MDAKKKKLKAENWSSDERMGMINYMLENFPKVSGKFSGTVLTSEKKNRAWEEVIKRYRVLETECESPTGG